MQSTKRRGVLRMLGGVGAWLGGGHSLAQTTAARPAPACVLTPEQTEGPYFVDERLERSDIRTDPANGSITPGVPFTLELAIVGVAGTRCAALPGAIVDIWHCDASGVYSDVDAGRGRTKFLRGYQITDATGRVRFTTIYPGAYAGRAVHIHFKVRPQDASRNVEFTSQLYFDDAMTDRVHAMKPYPGASVARTRNERDGLYRRGGRALTLDVAAADGGFAAAYDVGIRIA
jgi:protocatechuate 3,4-dioxygenase beta subunit